MIIKSWQWTWYTYLLFIPVCNITTKSIISTLLSLYHHHHINSIYRCNITVTSTVHSVAVYSAHWVQINAWQRPHIALRHLLQLSIALLFLHPVRTAQLRRFLGMFEPEADTSATLGPSASPRRRSISGLMRFVANVWMKSHLLMLLPVSLTKMIHALTPERSRMLQKAAIGQRRIGDFVEYIRAIESRRSTPHLLEL